MADEPIPHVVSESKITVLGIEMRCLQLSDGQRIFPAEDVENFFRAFGNPPLLCDGCGERPATRSVGDGNPDERLYLCGECEVDRG